MKSALSTYQSKTKKLDKKSKRQQKSGVIHTITEGGTHKASVKKHGSKHNINGSAKKLIEQLVSKKETWAKEVSSGWDRTIPEQSKGAKSKKQQPKVPKQKDKKKSSNQKAVPKLIPVNVVEKQTKSEPLSDFPKCVKAKKLTKELTKTVQANGRQMKSTDSEQIGLESFSWMLQSFDIKRFFSDYWEKKPLHLKGNGQNVYEELLCTEDLNRIFDDDMVFFTKNLDITSYVDGVRQTHNPEGRAFAPVVWDFYNNGCSIRMLNPQTFHEPLWDLLAKLQEFFGSFCGANLYLTPPGTQGFAPHWDDIEAFILQLEGKKHWRVYKPRVDNEQLPRVSSGNFSDDTDLGEPVIDCVLEAGDLLYFPRGYIHQGNALDDAHSLHVTISTYQKTSWVDLLEKLLPAALAQASEKDVAFRRGLPIGYLKHFGLVQAQENPTFEKQFCDTAADLVSRLMKHLPLDGAVDQMAKGFICDALPPRIDDREGGRSIYGGGEFWSAEEKRVVNRVELCPDTPIRLIRRNCLRLVVDEDGPKIYSTVNNSREYHEREPLCVDIDSATSPVVELLVQSYPKFVKIERLPADTLEDKITLAMALWERGLIRTMKPLEASYGE